MRLVTDGIEIWEGETKLTKLSAHPEIESESNPGKFKRKKSFVYGLQVRTINNFDAADKIEISYNVETEDFKSNVAFELGGSRLMTFGCSQKAKVLGKKQRLTIEFDKEIISIKSSDKTKKSYWVWLPHEDSDHNVTTSKDRAHLHIKEKIYNSFNVERTKPDTWGPTTVTAADDGYEENNATWYDDDGFNRIIVGTHGLTGHHQDAGLMWTVTDTDLPGAVIKSGTKINVNITLAAGSGATDLLRIVDSRTPGTWGSANRPSQQTLHPDLTAWNISSTGSHDSPDATKTLMQARIDGNDSAAAFQSGDKIAWIWFGKYGGEGYAVRFTEANATLTIVYGWLGKINGVTNPTKINGVAVANIKSVNGVLDS
jgi:hypothetical protein